MTLRRGRDEESTPLYFAVISRKEDKMDNVWTGRHPGVAHFEEMFRYDHLATDRLATVSARCAKLAEEMVGDLPDGPELTAGLRALWEAKNCFVVQAARFSGEDPGKNKVT